MAVFLRPFKPPLVLRQPPPLVRLTKDDTPMHGIHLDTLGKTKEEGKTESSNVAAPFRRGKRKMLYPTRPFYFRNCKMKMSKTTNTLESLPDEILLEILVRLPAEDLYSATQFVCQKWYKIIRTRDFIHAHLQLSKPGILAQTQAMWRHQQFFLASSGKSCLVDLSTIKYKFVDAVFSSCNGLVLEIHDNLHDLYITNPLTMQSFVLPPFPTTFALPCLKHKKIRYCFAMGYAATSMEYKVVRSFSESSQHEDGGVAILTVGVDKKWTRVVNTRHLSLAAKNVCKTEYPLTTQGGFVHWAQNETVLTMDLETEIITQFPVPPIPRSSLPPPRRAGENDELVNYYYLSMGSYLSLLIVRSMFSWEFWEMKPTTGEWTRQPDIDFEAQFAGQLNCLLVPGGWLKFREVLVFNLSFEKSDPRFPDASHFCFACNIRTHEFRKFELICRSRLFLAHTKTLEWLV